MHFDQCLCGSLPLLPVQPTKGGCPDAPVPSSSSLSSSSSTYHLHLLAPTCTRLHQLAEKKYFCTRISGVRPVLPMFRGVFRRSPDPKQRQHRPEEEVNDGQIGREEHGEDTQNPARNPAL